MAPRRHRWSPTCERPHNLFAPVRVDTSGLSGPTRGQAAGKKWRQVAKAWYVPAAANPSVAEQRILEAAVLLPPAGAVTGWAGLRWQGAGYFDGLAADGVTPLPVPLAIGPTLHLADRDGVTFLRDRLPESEVAVIQGIRCAKPERAVFDEIHRTKDLRDAVVALDMAFAAELTSLSRMRAFAGAHAGWNGVPLLRDALTLADERSWSPLESRVRLVWVIDARRPRPLTNRPVFERRSGRLLGFADLFDPDARVVGEVDGGEHGRPRRRSRDAVRDDWFRDCALETFRVTSYDLHQQRALVARINGAYARAERLAAQPRTWTLELPPDWPPLTNLDAVLEEREFKAALYQRWEDEPPEPSVIGL